MKERFDLPFRVLGKKENVKRVEVVLFWPHPRYKKTLFEQPEILVLDSVTSEINYIQYSNIEDSSE